MNGDALRGMRTTTILVIVIAFALVACRRGPGLSAMVLGSYPDRGVALYADALGFARSRGYQVMEENPAQGRFAVSAQRSRMPAALVVQCWQGGWIRITPAGGGVLQLPSGFTAPRDVEDELVTFASEMRVALGPGGVRR